MEPRQRSQLDKIESKLDHLHERVSSIDVTLARQEENLKEHMRRTAVAEANLDLHKEILKPIQSHVTKFELAFKIGGWTAASVAFLVSVAAGVIKIIEYFKP